MSSIVAGCICKVKFVSPNNNEYNEYINYITRDEATRKDYFNKFSLYNEYMNNPEKATGLFTKDVDVCTDEQKENIKKQFMKAQEKKSLMWQSVISFDNDYLRENGLMVTNEYGQEIVNEKQLKIATRKYMEEIEKRENLNKCVWSADIHYNTDNIHIHVAFVELDPKRKKVKYKRKLEDGSYKEIEEYKGTFKDTTLEFSKSKFINTIVNFKDTNKLINDIIRNKIINQEKVDNIKQDKELYDMFIDLYECIDNLGINRKLNYNEQKAKTLKPLINELSKKYIKKYHQKEYDDLIKILEEQDKRYKTAYGTRKNKDNKFIENKLNDLYQRMGNNILKEIYDFQLKEKEKNFILNRKKRLKIIEKRKKEYNKRMVDIYVHHFIYKIKNNIHKEIEKFKNQQYYEELQQEIEKNI